MVGQCCCTTPLRRGLRPTSSSQRSSSNMEKRALGKGLGALLPEKIEAASPGREVQDILLDHIIPNRYQPRTEFSESDLLELAESVRQNGLLQPVLVRRK